MNFFYTANGYYKKIETFKQNIETFEQNIDTNQNISLEISTQQNNLIILINNINDQKKKLGPQTNAGDKLNDMINSLQDIQTQFTVLLDENIKNDELIKQQKKASNNVNDINNKINDFKNQLDILYQNNNNNININDINKISGHINNLQEQLIIANYDLDQKTKLISTIENQNIINKLELNKKSIEELKYKYYMKFDNFLKDMDHNIEIKNNQIENLEQRYKFYIESNKQEIQIIQENLKKLTEYIQLKQQSQSQYLTQQQNIQQELNNQTSQEILLKQEIDQAKKIIQETKTSYSNTQEKLNNYKISQNMDAFDISLNNLIINFNQYELKLPLLPKDSSLNDVDVIINKSEQYLEFLKIVKNIWNSINQESKLNYEKLEKDFLSAKQNMLDNRTVISENCRPSRRGVRCEPVYGNRRELEQVVNDIRVIMLGVNDRINESQNILNIVESLTKLNDSILALLNLKKQYIIQNEKNKQEIENLEKQILQLADIIQNQVQQFKPYEKRQNDQEQQINELKESLKQTQSQLQLTQNNLNNALLDQQAHQQNLQKLTEQLNKLEETLQQDKNPLIKFLELFNENKILLSTILKIFR